MSRPLIFLWQTAVIQADRLRLPPFDQALRGKNGRLIASRDAVLPVALLISIDAKGLDGQRIYIRRPPLVYGSTVFWAVVARLVDEGWLVQLVKGAKGRKALYALPPTFPAIERDHWKRVLETLERTRDPNASSTSRSSAGHTRTEELPARTVPLRVPSTSTPQRRKL